MNSITDDTARRPRPSAHVLPCALLAGRGLGGKALSDGLPCGLRSPSGQLGSGGRPSAPPFSGPRPSGLAPPASADSRCRSEEPHDLPPRASLPGARCDAPAPTPVSGSSALRPQSPFRFGLLPTPVLPCRQIRSLLFSDVSTNVLFFRLIFSLLPTQLRIFQSQVRAHLLHEGRDPAPL